MDKSKARLERMRPILQAMERSIDAARQRRTSDGAPVPPPVAAVPEDRADGRETEPLDGVVGTPAVSGPVDPETATRMRARPKRPRGFDDLRPGRPA